MEDGYQTAKEMSSRNKQAIACAYSWQVTDNNVSKNLTCGRLRAAASLRPCGSRVNEKLQIDTSAAGTLRLVAFPTEWHGLLSRGLLRYKPNLIWIDVVVAKRSVRAPVADYTTHLFSA